MNHRKPRRFEQEVDANQKLWDSWTPVNANSDFYDLESFKNGNVVLPELDITALGDVTGKTLLHLQCHFGMDTLSWARLGAQVTGVDFSAAGIERARAIADELSIPARFVHCNVYDTREHVTEQFDVVLATAGVLSWLPDIEGWAAVAAASVAPGGQFYLREVHPLVDIFDDVNKTESLDVVYDYFDGGVPMHYVEKGSYADPDAAITNDAYYWIHTLSSVTNALIGSGLIIDEFREFPYLDWQQLSFMRERADGFWELPDQMPQIPLMYSLRAHKPGD